MNKSNAKDYLPLVQALAEGKVIQQYVDNGWANVIETFFSEQPHRYRVKPQPFECWVLQSSSGGLNVFNGRSAAEHWHHHHGGRIIHMREVE